MTLLSKKVEIQSNKEEHQLSALLQRMDSLEHQQRVTDKRVDNVEHQVSSLDKQLSD